MSIYESWTPCRGKKKQGEDEEDEKTKPCTKRVGREKYGVGPTKVAREDNVGDQRGEGQGFAKRNERANKAERLWRVRRQTASGGKDDLQAREIPDNKNTPPLRIFLAKHIRLPLVQSLFAT